MTIWILILSAIFQVNYQEGSFCLKIKIGSIVKSGKQSFNERFILYSTHLNSVDAPPDFISNVGSTVLSDGEVGCVTQHSEDCGCHFPCNFPGCSRRSWNMAHNAELSCYSYLEAMSASHMMSTASIKMAMAERAKDNKRLIRKIWKPIQSFVASASQTVTKSQFQSLKG